MAERKEIENAVVRATAKCLTLDESELAENMDVLLSVLGADSIRIWAIISELEGELDVDLDFSEVRRADSLSKVADYLESVCNA